MNRINVMDDDGVVTGWFDLDGAEVYHEATRWDGNNNVSIHTARFDHQQLLRTAGGRWVLCCWSQWQGTQTTYQFVSEETARDWLIKNGDDEVVAKYWGELETERGPGRPEVGQAINVRLGDDLLARVDALAAARAVSRAALLRDLVAAAMDAAEPGER